MHEFSPCRLLKFVGSSLVTASLLMVPGLIPLGNIEMNLVGTVHAKGGVCKDGTAPPCKPSGGEEGAGNRLSFPVIFSDNQPPTGWVPFTGTWFFEPVFDGTPPFTLAGGLNVPCVTETDIVPPATVPSNVLCYYGRKNLGLEANPQFEGDPKVWWLQQRTQNNWQVFNVSDSDAETAAGSITPTPVGVSGFDFGDLLESTTSLKQKQVRTEVTLLMDATSDSDYAQYIATNFGGSSCVLNPNDSGMVTAPNNCLAAHSMSGAVPGTDQSIAEIQGTDFGPGTGDVPGTGLVIDPTLVKKALDAGGNPVFPVHATVYSKCSRLLIQKIVTPADAAWSSDVDTNGHGGQWVGGGALDPVVDVAAWDNTYSAEINAGGSVINGYNWNTKADLDGSGLYRVTFVLEGAINPSNPTDPNAGRCLYPLNTVFGSDTVLVNPGNVNPGTLLSADALAAIGAHHGEGGAAYVDINIQSTGQGGGGGGRNR